MSRPITARELGIMVGYPPSKDQTVTLANWQDPPYNRWSFQHVSNVLPTAMISRGSGPIIPLARADKDLSGITFEDITGDTLTLGEMLDSTYTDGFIVLKGGSILFEQYFNDMNENTRHLLMSVSKSIAGSLAGCLVAARLLDSTKLVSHYVPELAASAFGDATVRQTLDMQVSVVYSEEYADPEAEVQYHEKAAGWRPRSEDDIEGHYTFLQSLKKDDREHGLVFQYASPCTDVIGWVLERAAGIPYADLMSREVWSKLGCEHDADITVDMFNSPLADGGISATLRDSARFAQMMLQNGSFNDQQIVPAGWIADNRGHGDNAAWSRHEQWSTVFADGHYRAFWYNTEDDHRSYFGIGVFGQVFWIDPTAGMVIVKFSSQPKATDLEMALLTLRGLAAIGKELVSG